MRKSFFLDEKIIFRRSLEKLECDRSRSRATGNLGNEWLLVSETRRQASASHTSLQLSHISQSRLQMRKGPKCGKKWDHVVCSRQKGCRSRGGGIHWGLPGQNQDRSGLRLRSGFDCRPFGRAGVGLPPHLIPKHSLGAADAGSSSSLPCIGREWVQPPVVEDPRECSRWQRRRNGVESWDSCCCNQREREREKESIPQSESLTNRFGSSETKYDRQIQIVKIQMRVKAMLHFRCGPIELPSILAAVSVLSRWRFLLKDSPPSLRAPWSLHWAHEKWLGAVT